MNQEIGTEIEVLEAVDAPRGIIIWRGNFPIDIL